MVFHSLPLLVRGKAIFMTHLLLGGRALADVSEPGKICIVKGLYAYGAWPSAKRFL